LPLSEKVRIEIFIPDLSDPVYGNILDELGNELRYALGGCTFLSTRGKYRSSRGLIVPDKVHLLFSDTAFQWIRDRALIEGYADRMQTVVKRALSREESILVVAYPVSHSE
jgi:hypothetical protein